MKYLFGGIIEIKPQNLIIDGVKLRKEVFTVWANSEFKNFSKLYGINYINSR